jgi:hypothetical protein
MENKYLLLVVVLVLSQTFESQAEGFVPDDQVISDPSVSLVDPEIDQLNHRIAWQSLDNELWVADLDPVTAALSPPDGKGTLIDTNLAPLISTLNGPEWAYGLTGAWIVYTKSQTFGFNIAAAKQLQDGSWAANGLQNSLLRFLPLGTPISNTQTPVKTTYYYYNQQTSSRFLAWRNLNNPETEQFFPDSTATSARWVEDLPLLVFPAKRNGYKQVVLLDTESLQPSQITFDPTDKYLPFIWFAPEYGELLMMVMMGKTDIGIYHQAGDEWDLIYQFSLPTTKPFVHSPEPFVYNDKSYILVVAADQLGGGGSFPGSPIGPTEIWISGVDAAQPFFRRIDNPLYDARRLDPEIYLTTNDAVALYTEQLNVSKRFVLKRAYTSLASEP